MHYINELYRKIRETRQELVRLNKELTVLEEKLEQELARYDDTQLVRQRDPEDESTLG
jgi:hypothetical protein